MIAFVILHYQDAEMTHMCVDNIKRVMRGKKYHIIIVDNASPDNIGEKIKIYYKEDKNCTVIINKENLGFAKGNNIGYLYAKENFHPQYIVVMNNDVLIEQIDFSDKIDEIYRQTGFYILGPNIVQEGTGQKQNPMTKHSKQEILKIYNSYMWKSKFPRISFMIEVLQGKVKRKLGKYKKNICDINNCIDEMERIYNPVLHGACYIVSNLFINKEDRLFDTRTFLYWEEYLLWIYCNTKKYILVFDPSISVRHISGHATIEAWKNAYERTKNFYRYYFDSLKILVNEMDKVQ